MRNKDSILVKFVGILLLAFIFMQLSTSVLATTTTIYQTNFAKGTEYFEVTQYDEDAWLTTVQDTWKLYDGTYNFEGDKIGKIPTGPIVKELGNNTARIVEEEDGHAQVLKFDDVDEYNVDMNILFLNQTQGTIEFYLKYNNSRGADRFTIGFRQDYSTKFSLMYVANESRWLYYTNNTYHEAPNLKPINDDEWHHMIIHFECENNTYQGLAGNTTKVILDSDNSTWLSFSSGAEYINDLFFATNFSLANYSYFIDAIGFSWDEDYTIGDNINNWEIASILPSTWFEGESLDVGARSKYTTRGSVEISRRLYDVILSVLFPSQLLLFASIEDLGYNKTEINANYTYKYDVAFSLRVFWNYTTEEFQEEPSKTGVPTFLLKNPEDYKILIEEYNHLIGTIKNDTAIPSLIREEFSEFTADEFLWYIAINGLGTANPINEYLSVLIDELECENATVDDDWLVIQRYGETNYSVAIQYGEFGTPISYVVNDQNNVPIYQIKSRGNNLVGFYIFITIFGCSLVGVLMVIVIVRKRKPRV